MKGKGIKSERETVIVFNEEDQTASVWTASEVTYRRLLKVGYQPSKDNDRSAVFEMAKRDIRLPKPKRIISEAQRERLRQVRPRREGVGLGVLGSKL